MGKPLGIGLMVMGIALLVFGFHASNSVASNISRLFTGEPTDRAIWMLLSGMVLIVVGAISWRGR